MEKILIKKVVIAKAPKTNHETISIPKTKSIKSGYSTISVVENK